MGLVGGKAPTWRLENHRQQDKEARSRSQMESPARSPNMLFLVHYLSHQDHHGPSSSSPNLPQLSALLYPSPPVSQSPVQSPKSLICYPLPSLSSLLIVAWDLRFSLAPETASKLVIRLLLFQENPFHIEHPARFFLKGRWGGKSDLHLSLSCQNPSPVPSHFNVKPKLRDPWWSGLGSLHQAQL